MIETNFRGSRYIGQLGNRRRLCRRAPGTLRLEADSECSQGQNRHETCADCTGH